MEEAAEGNDLPGGETPSADEPQIDKWSDFLQEDAEDVEEPEAVEPEPAPAKPETPTEEPPPVPPPAEPQPVPGQQPAPQEQRPSLTPEQLKELRAKFEETIASRYQFSDEEVVGLQSEPEKVLPKLAAKLYADVLDDVNRMMQESVPQMLQVYTQASTREEKARGEFYSAWPELQKYEQQVLHMGQMYVQMNPTADPQTRIQRIGEMTMAALGLKRAAPPEPTPSALPPSAFKPAGAGRVATPPPPTGKWDQFLNDDE
jgi:hypothetical protein